MDDLIKKITKWTKRLKREMRAHPAKAAVLGLLLAVAAYFWAPLLKGSGDETKGNSPATASSDAKFVRLVESQAAGKIAAPSTQANRTRTVDWRQMADALDGDPATRPAETLIARPSPFALMETTEPEPEPADAEPVQFALSPDSLGMKLSATVTGVGRRVAVIDGVAYAEGRDVELTRDGRRIEFRLSEVHPRRIVLERSGQRFVLEIPQEDASPRIETAGL